MGVSQEEVIAELETKVDRLTTALELLLVAVINDLTISSDVAIAAGEASNVLKGLS